MKLVLTLFLVLAAVYRVAESAASSCHKPATATATVVASSSGACTTATDLCFESVTVAVADGAKVYSRGCTACIASVGTPGLNNDKTMWELKNCCDGDGTGDGIINCNSADFSATTTLGPKCMECNCADEKCVKGGETAAGPYVAGTDVCDVLTSSCYVEMKADGTVTRGCKAACADAGKPGDATFTKCCITKDHCNQDDATKTSTDGGDGDGAQAVFASYALLFSCLLLAYLK